MDVGDVGIAGPGPADSGEMGDADFGGGLFGGMEGITGDMGAGSVADNFLGQMPMGLEGLFGENIADDVSMNMDSIANLPSFDVSSDNSNLSKMSKFAGIVAGLLGMPNVANVANMTSIASSTNPISGMVSMGLHAANPALGMIASSLGIPGMIGNQFAGVDNQGVNSVSSASAGNATADGMAASGGGSMDMMGALPGLLGMYAGYQGQKDASGMLGGLQGLYSQDSPYSQMLRQQLQRRDAAGGRRSQYGPREVELQAKLAQMASGQIGNMSQLQQRQNINRAQMLQQGLGAFQKLGGINSLKDLFGMGGAGGMYETTALNALNNGSMGNSFDLGNIFGNMPPSQGYDFGNLWGG